MDLKKLLDVASAKINNVVSSFSQPQISHNPLVQGIDTAVHGIQDFQKGFSQRYQNPVDLIKTFSNPQTRSQTIVNAGKTLQSIPSPIKVAQDVENNIWQKVAPQFNQNYRIPLQKTPNASFGAGVLDTPTQYANSLGNSLTRIGQGQFLQGGLGSKAEDIGNLAFFTPLTSEIRAAGGAGKLEQAANYLRNVADKPSVDLIKNIVADFQTNSRKVPQSELLKLENMAVDMYGEQARTLKNSQLVNLMDATLKRIGTKPNDFNLGLAVNDIRATSQKPNLKISIKANPLESQQGLPIGAQKTLAKGTQEASSPNIIAQEARRVLTDNGVVVKEKGFISRIKTGTKYPENLQKMLNGTYVQRDVNTTIADAKQLVRKDPIAAEERALNPENSVDNAIGMELINHYMSIGNTKRANALANSIGGSNEGQMIQILSQYNKLSPAGAVKFASNIIKNYNKSHANSPLKLTDAQITSIYKKAEKIQAMKEGTKRNIASNNLINDLNALIPSSLSDKLITIWKAGLLTSLRTHERNMIGNAIQGGAEIAKDVIASPADMLMSLKTGQRTLTFTTKGTLSGAQKGIKIAKDVITKGYDPEQAISKFDIKKINWGNNPVEKMLKVYTEAVFRPLAAEDKVFWHSAYARSMYDQAQAAAINAGKSSNTRFIENLVKNPTEEMLKTALNDANIATFKDKTVLAEIANRIKEAASRGAYNKGGTLGKVTTEVLMPFTGVPSSVAANIVRYSPIGLVKGMVNVGRVLATDVPNLQRQAAQELGRGVMGTALFALGAYLASKGLMTGQPKDAKEAAQWQLENKPYNSVLLPGLDGQWRWRQIGSVGPQNLILLAGAKANEELNKGQDASLVNFGFNIGKDYTQQTFLQGVQGPLSALTDPTANAKTYFGNQSASLIPNIVKDTSKALDPYSRETNNVQDYFINGIPLVRNGQLPKRDNLGNIIAQEPSGVGAFIDLFNSKTPITNNVVDELSRLNQVGQNATPTKLTKNQTINGVKMTLTPKQLNQLEATSGPQVTEALNALFQQPDYQALSDEDKANAISNVVSKVKKQVRGTIDLNGATPDLGYTHSSDAPNGILGTMGLYGQSIITDPGQTLQAVLKGNPIRKVQGGAVILERKNGLSALDNGDTSTQVDHKIALTLGGTNDSSNLQILTTSENKIKGEVETYLYNEMKAGRITKSEAQKRDLNWKNEIQNLPKNVQEKLVKDLSTPEPNALNKTYTLVDPETGNVTTIDLSKPIEKPKLTGNTELDKELTSNYNSALTTRANNIVKLYKAGKIDAKTAEEELNKLKNSKISTSNKFKLPTGLKNASPQLKNILKEQPIKLQQAPKLNVKNITFKTPFDNVGVPTPPKFQVKFNL